MRLELGRVTKCCKKQKRTIRKWRVDRFSDEGVRAKYSEALKAEVESFSKSKTVQVWWVRDDRVDSTVVGLWSLCHHSGGRAS